MFETKAWEVCKALVLKGEPVPEAETDQAALFDSMVSIYCGQSNGQLWVGSLR